MIPGRPGSLDARPAGEAAAPGTSDTRTSPARDAIGSRPAIDPTPQLAAVEAAERVAVIFAAESASRAWGFPSPDSDWDVRFIYARPTLWHLRIEPGRDVIERQLPGELDLAGWDMRKTLGLILRGNCTVREWLASPLVYRSEDGLAGRLRALCEMVPARRAAWHHYVSLARGVHGQWLRRNPVNLKKYLYAIRPALVLRWLRTHAGSTPPMDIDRLLAEVATTPGERDELHHLLEQKARASELGMGAPLPAIDAMIDSALDHGAAAALAEPREAASREALDFAHDLMIAASAFADLTTQAPR
jgi:predicted nucleotidyltransferase